MGKNLTIKRIKQIVIYQLKQFCLNTSLHGWKYTALPKTSKFERYIWLVICFASLGVSIFLLALASSRFESNPTITVTESTQHYIYKFMFPAVTICSFNKISKSAAFEMAHKLEGPNSSNIELLAHNLKLLFHLGNNDNYSVPNEDYENLHRILKNKGYTEEEAFNKISPSCNKLIKKCMWKGEAKPCETMFQKIKTPIGYCCSFNYYALKNNSVYGSSLFIHKLPKNPRKTSSCGYQSGLEVLLDNDVDNYFATHIPSTGFRVLIHNPYDFPDWAVPNVMCEINSNNFIGVNPEIINATQSIKSILIANRNCLFTEEKKLDNFVRYTFHNCMVECKMLLILELCGCIPFYVHNKAGSYGTTNVCTLKDIPCITKNEQFMFNTSFMEERKNRESGACYCLPECESASYVPESSKGVLDASYCTNPFGIYSDNNLRNHTILRVFFNDLLGTRHRRDVLFTWPTLMGYYGGIIALFTGFSCISVVEIFYFSVIRILTHVINRKIEDQPQDNEVLQFGRRKQMRAT